MVSGKVVDNLNARAICLLAHRLRQVDPSFLEQEFLNYAIAGLSKLALFERANHIADALRVSLSKNIPNAMGTLVRSLGPPRKGPGYGPMENFWILPLTRFVGRFGLPHFTESMESLYEMTRRFTAEFDVRPFLIQYPERTLPIMRKWAQDTDLHVRRLVSEGTRIRLPWAKHLEQFKRDPRPIIRIIECLKDDSEMYVRRSVANNLADIIKDNPDAAYSVLHRWSCNAPHSRRWLIRHAARLPYNRKDPRALELVERLNCE